MSLVRWDLGTTASRVPDLPRIIFNFFDLFCCKIFNLYNRWLTHILWLCPPDTASLLANSGLAAEARSGNVSG